MEEFIEWHTDGSMEENFELDVPTGQEAPPEIGDQRATIATEFRNRTERQFHIFRDW